MHDSNDKFINTKEASKITGMSEAWFERKRWLKEGPPMYKIGKKSVRYKLSELLSWFESNQKKEIH